MTSHQLKYYILSYRKNLNFFFHITYIYFMFYVFELERMDGREKRESIIRITEENGRPRRVSQKQPPLPSGYQITGLTVNLTYSHLVTFLIS